MESLALFLQAFLLLVNIMSLFFSINQLFKSSYSHFYFLSFHSFPFVKHFLRDQGRSDSTSSVTFEVLIINCHIEFINLFIFNCLKSNINLFIFNCLTSNFCFPKNISFASRRERLFTDARP